MTLINLKIMTQKKKRFKKYDDSRKNLAARSSEKSEDADAINELIDLV